MASHTIVVDWGTTAFRAWRVGTGGTVLDARADAEGGILDVARGQVGELLLQGGDHEALEIGIQGGGEAALLGESGHRDPPIRGGGRWRSGGQRRRPPP